MYIRVFQRNGDAVVGSIVPHRALWLRINLVAMACVTNVEGLLTIGRAIHGKLCCIRSRCGERVRGTSSTRWRTLPVCEPFDHPLPLACWRVRSWQKSHRAESARGREGVCPERRIPPVACAKLSRRGQAPRRVANSRQTALYLDVKAARCIEQHSLLFHIHRDPSVTRTSWSTPSNIRWSSEFLSNRVESASFKLALIYPYLKFVSGEIFEFELGV